MRAALEPAGAHRSDLMLAKLMQYGFILPDSIDPEMAPELYADVLRDKPVGAMRRVFENLRLGRYERFRSFLPKPAELSALVDEAARHDREMLRIERERVSGIEERRRLSASLSPEEKQRRREKVAAAKALIAGAAAHRTTGGHDDRH
ncbi:hypothetical protein [Martelella endophytica]|nr:hypothetical protein [Martelella endophytica]